MKTSFNIDHEYSYKIIERLESGEYLLDFGSVNYLENDKEEYIISDEHIQEAAFLFKYNIYPALIAVAERDSEGNCVYVEDKRGTKKLVLRFVIGSRFLKALYLYFKDERYNSPEKNILESSTITFRSTQYKITYEELLCINHWN